jgi:hypothetical protein
MKRSLTPLFFLITVFILQAQPKNFDNLHYSKGIVVLNDGSLLSGQLKYSTREGLLFYKNDTESRVYTPRGVQYFSFSDSDKNPVRRFYSLKYEDELNGGEGFYFFEVIEELPAFAVLVKIDPMEIKSSVYYTTLASTIGFPTTTFNSPYKPIHYKKQDETVFLLKPKGDLQPYLITKYIYKNNRTYRRSRLFRKALLPKYFGGSFHKIEAFSKENKLDFEDRNDFLKMVGYYKQLSN